MDQVKELRVNISDQFLKSELTKVMTKRGYNSMSRTVHSILLEYFARLEAQRLLHDNS